jgi:hypothetical protein
MKGRTVLVPIETEVWSWNCTLGTSIGSYPLYGNNFLLVLLVVCCWSWNILRYYFVHCLQEMW